MALITVTDDFEDGTAGAPVPIIPDSIFSTSSTINYLSARSRSGVLSVGVTPSGAEISGALVYDAPQVPDTENWVSPEYTSVRDVYDRNGLSAYYTYEEFYAIVITNYGTEENYLEYLNSPPLVEAPLLMASAWYLCSSQIAGTAAFGFFDWTFFMDLPTMSVGFQDFRNIANYGTAEEYAAAPPDVELYTKSSSSGSTMDFPGLKIPLDQWLHYKVTFSKVVDGVVTSTLDVSTEAGVILHTVTYTQARTTNATFASLRAYPQHTTAVGWLLDDVAFTHEGPDPATVIYKARVFPRDDGLNASSAPRVYPSPKAYRVVGDIP